MVKQDTSLSNHIFRNSVWGSVIICAVSSALAYIWSYDTFLSELMVGMVAIASLVGGFIVSIVVQLISNRFGKNTAVIVSAVIIAIAIFSLLLGYY